MEIANWVKKWSVHSGCDVVIIVLVAKCVNKNSMGYFRQTIKSQIGALASIFYNDSIVQPHVTHENQRFPSRGWMT